MICVLAVLSTCREICEEEISSSGCIIPLRKSSNRLTDMTSFRLEWSLRVFEKERERALTDKAEKSRRGNPSERIEMEAGKYEAEAFPRALTAVNELVA